MLELITSQIGYLENNASFVNFHYAEFHHGIVNFFLKSHVNIINLIRKVFKHWVAVKLSGTYVFQNSNFFLKAQTFITGNKYYQLCSFKLQAHLFHFQKCLPNSKPDNHNLLVVPWKMTKSAHKCKQGHKCFPQDNHHILLCQGEMLYPYVPSCHGKY